MKTIFHWIKNLYSGPFQAPLVFAFTIVSAITIGIGALVISTTINNYLATAMDERIARDIHLAQSYYDLDLREVTRISEQVAGNQVIVTNLEAAGKGDAIALSSIQDQIQQEAGGTTLGGNLYVAVINVAGNLISCHLTTLSDQTMSVAGDGNWAELPFVQKALVEGIPIASTEIIPGEYLEKINLANQAYIKLIDTPKASSQPFDSREGSAGLVIIGITPIVNGNAHIIGAALTFHLFNNDFTLVDEIKNTAGIDTVTIFLGDLRVSTNVMTDENQRAVGTRLAEEVSDVVLYHNRPYVGTAFVVNETYITRYEPLSNSLGQVVGALYVGTRQASFLQLLNMVDQRVSVIAVLTILLTFVLATPVSRIITRPLKELRDLTHTSRRVAEGDLDARATLTARGEVGQLAADFNNMLDTLQVTQDQLMHSEKLASLGQLAAGVAHELNNPLGTILLYAETMMKERSEDDPERADLKMIVNETQRSKRVVSDLLNFARQNQVIVQMTDLHGIIRELIDLIPSHVNTVPITIKKELDHQLPLIEADPSQLRQVLLNLMINAVEAMPEGGILTLRTLSEPDKTVTVEVQDTGLGIPEENLSKLFTPFFTTKPIGKGTGLGLAIAYGIVKMHRGQITVRSEVGRGTTFSINLPVQVPPGSDRAPSREQMKGDQSLIG
jgi:two-component system NtrC family sensor kinase